MTDGEVVELDLMHHARRSQDISPADPEVT